MKPSRSTREMQGGRPEPRGRPATIVTRRDLARGRALLAVGALCLCVAGACAASTDPKGSPAASGGRSVLSPASRGDQLALPSTQAIQSVSRLSGAKPLNQQAARPHQLGQPSAEASIANPKVENVARDMQQAAGHHYGGGHGHGKYYMYAESPKKGAYKAGFKRGNHKHMIERKEYQHKSHAGGYMKWHGKKGKGSHKWEYKHYDKKGKHHY